LTIGCGRTVPQRLQSLRSFHWTSSQLRQRIFSRCSHIRVAVLHSSVPTDKREDWYERQLKPGVEVVICHPKLVETGLDLLAFRSTRTVFFVARKQALSAPSILSMVSRTPYCSWKSLLPCPPYLLRSWLLLMCSSHSMSFCRS
jgi:hypothetical protein